MIVHWTDRATARLRAIEAYIAEANPAAARSIVEKLLRRSWQLGEPPDIGHPVRGYEHADLREVLVRPYRLIYRIRSTQVDVITVMHYRQLLPTDLEILVD